MGFIDHLKHEVDLKRGRRWKKAILGFVAIHVIFAAVYTEDYIHNWEQNKAQWSYLKQHRGKGIVAPYQVKYDTQRMREKNIEVLWDTHRKDVS